MSLTAQQILAVPLEELRERVELAERLALASRLTPSGAYAGEPTVVNNAAPAAGDAAPAKPRGRPKKDDAAASGAAAAPAATNADDLMAAMTGTQEQAGSGDLSLDDISGTGELSDDDMLAGFTQAEPIDYKAEITKLVTDIQTKKDEAGLKRAREFLKSIGVQRAGEVPEEKLAEFYKVLTAG